MFRPSPQIESMPLGDGGAVHVIDDALVEPERWVAYALAERARFARSPHNAFPGPELRLPDAATAKLDAFFAQHLRHALGARRTLRAYSRLSLVTLAPSQLVPRQWICHRDRMELESGRCVAACVLYLFRDEALGGTSFYRPLRPEAEIAKLVHDSGVLDAAAFQARYGIAPGYPLAGNAWFEKVLTVPARWNRLIFYDGMRFHCGEITAPERLSDDPRQGRLALNGFFTCRRAVAPAPFDRAGSG